MITPNPLDIYPNYLRQSARQVEQTRDDRLDAVRRGEAFPHLSLSDRNAWVEEFHPDHQEDALCPLQVGASRGQEVPKALAALLEAWPRPGVRALLGHTLSNVEVIETDILVIGGGGAGTAAAIAAAETGAQVLIVAKLRQNDSNTIMAEGGMQVADQECDSPIQHYLDMIGGGHFSNNPSLVEALVFDGPDRLRWLEDLGMLFDKYPTGRMVVRHGGGTSRKRLHSAGDVTGLEMMRVMRDHAANFPNITALEFAPAVELLTDDNGRAVGAVLERLTGRGEMIVVHAKAVVLATGGLGRLHLSGFPTSNHYGATADGLTMAYRAGLPLRDLRHSQYHPTGVAFPEQKLGAVVTEKFRGLGAQILNRHGDEFVFALEPRDVTTAAIIRECREYNNGVITPVGGVGVWLDVPMIDLLHGFGTIEREFPGRFQEFLHKGFDIRRIPLLVYPTLHYQNGGVVMEVDGSTDMPGLFAAGEVSGGVHGHNRLMGNALLEILVFGKRAGSSAAEFANRFGAGGTAGFSHVEAFMEQLQEAGIPKTQYGPLLLPVYGGQRPKLP